MRFHTLDDLAARGRRVLLRADLNVPMKAGASPTRPRIERLAPTIVELAGKGARVVVMSHFGRPDGKRVASMSLAPLAARSRGARRQRRRLRRGCVGASAPRRWSARSADGEVGLLENLRFHREEEANDLGFAARLAALGDLYVNDAFSAAHRAHASTTALASCCRPRRAADAGRARGARQGARATRRGRWPRSSAAPRSRPSSTCSATCWPRSTCW
jgi:phosphoglycerate kinase